MKYYVVDAFLDGDFIEAFGGNKEDYYIKNSIGVFNEKYCADLFKQASDKTYNTNTIVVSM